MTEQETFEYENSEPLGDRPEFCGQCLWCGEPSDPGHTCDHVLVTYSHGYSNIHSKGLTTAS